MSEPDTPAAEWAALMASPAAYIDASRLAAVFGGAVSTALCERLRGCGRLHGRLSEMIGAFYALESPCGPQDVDDADRRIALLSAAETDEVVRRAGAVYWGNAIANMVRAEEVRTLRERLGESTYAFALAHRSLSGAARVLDLAGAEERIAGDGLRCLAAWCETQPHPIGARVRLKHSANPALDEPVQSPFNDIGPAIIRCAAA